MILRANCRLEGLFMVGDRFVYEVNAGDEFDVDKANADRLIRRKQASAPLVKRSKKKKGGD